MPLCTVAHIYSVFWRTTGKQKKWCYFLYRIFFPFFLALFGGKGKCVQWPWKYKYAIYKNCLSVRTCAWIRVTDSVACRVWNSFWNISAIYVHCFACTSHSMKLCQNSAAGLTCSNSITRDNILLRIRCVCTNRVCRIWLCQHLMTPTGS